MAMNSVAPEPGTGAGMTDIKELVERAPDIVFHYQLSPIPAFCYVNAAAGGILGYSPEEHYQNPSLWLERSWRRATATGFPHFGSRDA